MGKRYRVGCKALDDLGKGRIVFHQKEFFVPYFLPGEKGEIELVYRARETGARLVSLDEATRSADRVDPACPVYEACGGCGLRHLSYEAQLRWKQEKLVALFPREAASGKLLPIIGMKEPQAYRHKIYAAFSRGAHGEPLAGTYEEGSHRVVGATACPLQNATANRILDTIVALMKETGTPPYDEDRHTGVLRHVYLRVGAYSGQVMVVLVTGSREFRAKQRFVRELCRRHPEITTIVHNVNDRKTSMVLGASDTVLYGNGYIEDSLCGCRFRISPQSFYQVNPIQTELLYRTAIAFAGLSGKERVLDAYCGIGTITLLAARHAKEAIGVEKNAAAVRDARENAVQNGCTNVRFLAQDAGKYMAAHASDKDRPEVVFLDPPRSGSDETFLRSLLKFMPERIVYISCNPVTQQRDVKVLRRGGYQIERIQGVDCFPHTEHVETCVLLSQKKTTV